MWHIEKFHCKKSKNSQVSPLQSALVRTLIPADAVARINFYRWMLQSVHHGTVDSTLLFMSDEARFHHSGFVNGQNTRNWDTDNPHTTHEVQLHHQNVSVWSSVGGRRIVEPIFLFSRRGELSALRKKYCHVLGG
jgi:hypothetical protein